MGSADAGVDNVGRDAGSTSGVKDVVRATDFLVGKADKARGSVDLGNEGIGLDLGVSLNVSHLFSVVNALDHVVIGIKRHGTPGVHLEGVDFGRQEVAAEASLANVALLDGGSKLGLLGRDGLVAKRAVVDDNVAVRDNVLSVGIGDEAHKLRQVDIDPAVAIVVL